MAEQRWPGENYFGVRVRKLRKCVMLLSACGTAWLFIRPRQESDEVPGA